MVAPNATKAQRRNCWWRKRKRMTVTSERVTKALKSYLLVLNFSSEKLRLPDK